MFCLHFRRTALCHRHKNIWCPTSTNDEAPPAAAYTYAQPAIILERLVVQFVYAWASVGISIDRHITPLDVRYCCTLLHSAVPYPGTKFWPPLGFSTQIRRFLAGMLCCCCVRRSSCHFVTAVTAHCCHRALLLRLSYTSDVTTQQ